MRGRSLWRDPPVASACAFCAHRMGAPRPRLPSHVQRRFLQTTRPTARPPSTAAAVREEPDDDDPEYSNQSANWGNRPASTGPAGRSWGAPSFGSGAASPLGPASTGFGRPAFGSATIELTEEEKQAASRLRQDDERGNPRPITLFAGPGPESHRGGRPEPYTPKAENPVLIMAREKHIVAKSGFAGIRQTILRPETQDRFESRAESQPSFSIRYEGNPNPQIRNETPAWGSLRRRNAESATSLPQPQLNSFARDRAEREERAKAARYTPVTGKPIFGTKREANRFPAPKVEADEFERMARSTVHDSSAFDGAPRRYPFTQVETDEFERRARDTVEPSAVSVEPPEIGEAGIRGVDTATPSWVGAQSSLPSNSQFSVRNERKSGDFSGVGRSTYESKILESSERSQQEANRRPGEKNDIGFSAGPKPEGRSGGVMYQPKSYGLPGTRSGLGIDKRFVRPAFGSREAEGRPVAARSREGFNAPSYERESAAGWAYQPKSFGLPGTRNRLGMEAPEENVNANAGADAGSFGRRGWERKMHVEELVRQPEVELDREGRAKKRAEKYAAEELAKAEREAEAPTNRGRDKSRRRQQFVAQYEETENEESAAAKAEKKRLRKREKAAKKAAAPTPVFLPEYITVANLALALKVRVDDFVEKMEELGFEETGYDFILNSENAGLIAQEYNFEPIIDQSESLDLKARPAPEDPSTLPPRAPVVTIMGHVDHGKTTLLDYLRKSSVAATEHGGITQHIGAFSVPMPSGKVITFLDTPGHAAFLNMRQRGANVTDIVILVVAADDSVKPQTIEAIKHAKAAQVPMIVAINKVDKEEANIERVKQDLARHGVEIEDYGGDTQVVCVSGKTGQGMAELEEAAVTLTEILDMRADIDGPAEGWVLEASIKSMGKVATVLVRRGTMRPGDFIVAGKTWARIRCLRNEAGVDIEEAGPGTPVEIDGWKEQPLAGDEVLQASTEQKAKSVVDYRNEREEREKLAEDMEAINDSRKLEQEKRETEKQEKLLAEASKADGEEALISRDETPKGAKQVYFIIKGDVSGSVEAVIDSISLLSTKEVQAHILRSGVGQISEFDVEHAAAAKGYLINFNTPIEPKISSLAEASKVQIIDHNIIYRLMDDVKAKMSEFLPPLVSHKVLGEAEVAQVFQINIKGRQTKAMAGCKVRNGIVAKNVKVRVLRGGEKIFDGNLSSLKHIKKDVAEMRKGGECGIGFDGWTDFQVGDQIQSYEMTEEKRYL